MMEVIRKLKLVRKQDGKVPSDGAMSEAAKTFLIKKSKRGRKVGSKSTSKAEDKQIMAVFRKLRPPGNMFCY